MNKFHPLVIAFFLIMIQASFAGTIFQKRLNYKIIIPENSTVTQKLAATELKKFLAEIYDENIDLNNSRSQIAFYVGNSSESKQNGFSDIQDLNTNFGVFRKNRAFLFCGYDNKNVDPVKTMKGYAGTLSSVYYFFNKHLGVTFLYPGDKGYLLVKNKKIIFPALKETPIPSFQLRGFSFRTKSYSRKDLTLFFRRMLGNVPYWASKDLYYIFMYKWKKRFWKTHPEYFMLRGGKRVSERYPYHIPCLTNPDVIRQTAADLIRELNAKPEIKTIRLFCDAPISQCQCARCAKSKERSLAKVDLESGEEFYGFQKRVADIVHKSHPNVTFFSQTKGRSYYRPPTLLKLGSSFTIAQLVPRVNPQSDFDFYVDLARRWKRNGVRTVLKSYPRYDVKTYRDYPVMTPYYTVDYLRKFAGVVEGANNSELDWKIPYSFSALGQYVQMKSLFDINAPAEKWVREFCALAYPGTGDVMVEFYSTMDQLYRKRCSSLGDPLLDAYYPDNLNKPMALLDAAAKKIDKSRSTWFNDLYRDFKKFHAYCQTQKVRVDKLREWGDKTFSIPLLNSGDLFDENPKSWTNILNIPFMTPNDYDDFQKTNLRMACSKKYLFLGLIADEKHTGKLKSECETVGEGAIWSDDCFEIMLKPLANEKAYYQIVCNSLGVYRVLKCGDKKTRACLKDLKVDVKAAVRNGEWSVALRIPLDQFPKGVFKKLWKFDAFRSRYLKERNSDEHQISGISLLSSSYHNVNEYVGLKWPKL
jgi:hypothetical protein